MKKYFFSVAENKLIDSDGKFSADAKSRPQSTLGQKDYINIQFVQNSTLPLVDYTEFLSGTTARFLVDVDYQNAGVFIPMGNTGWSLSSGSEYKKILSTKPDTVEFNGVDASEGTVGALAAGEWGYIDLTTEIVVRLTDNTDPTTKAEDYVQVLYTNSSATPLFIEASSDVFNLPNSWLDDDGVTLRDPVITDGEVSFYRNSNTVNFYNRLAGSAVSSDGFAEVQFFAPSTAVFFMKAKFAYDCTNRLLSSGEDVLELAGVDVYTKAESDAKYLNNGFSVYGTKAAIVDADTIAANDSEDSGSVVVITFTKIWTWIKSKLGLNDSTNEDIAADGATTIQLGRLDAGRGFDVVAMFNDEVSGSNEGASLKCQVFISGTATAKITNLAGDSDIANLDIITGIDVSVTGAAPDEVVNLVVTTTAGNALKMNYKAIAI